MVVVGITGRQQRAAAAVAIDGRIVAAVTEASVTRVLKAGYRNRGVPVRAVATCLEIAGVSAAAVDALVIADSSDRSSPAQVGGISTVCGLAFSRAKKYRISRLGAHARLGAAAFDSPLVLSSDFQSGRACLTEIADGNLQWAPIPEIGELFSLALKVAAALGGTVDDPAELLTQLEYVARTEPQGQVAVSQGNTFAADGGTMADVEELNAKLIRSREEFGDSLPDASNPLVKVQRARADLAGGLLVALAAAIAHVVERRAALRGLSEVTLAGSAFADPDFNDRLQARTSIALSIAPAPLPEGAALGAALSPYTLGDVARWPDHLSLGPSFTEYEAKVALENCRLDYVYEPSWPRLIDRISRTLARGKVVAWFQQSAEFCSSVGGSRSILCDPSNRYARDNINRFLRQRADDAPIGVSVPIEASDCLTIDIRSPWMMSAATVASDSRDRLRAAVDSAGRAHVHVVQPASHQLFHELLTTHWRRTGVPGLLNTALHGVGEPAACSPRDAIRTTYSSAVDAMVIHRFLVMKDYWQLRTDDV